MKTLKLSTNNNFKVGDLVLHEPDRRVGILVEKSDLSDLEDFWKVMCEDGEKIWSRYKCKIVASETDFKDLSKKVTLKN